MAAAAVATTTAVAAATITTAAATAIARTTATTTTTILFFHVLFSSSSSSSSSSHGILYIVGLHADVLRLKTIIFNPHISFPVYTWGCDKMVCGLSCIVQPFQITSQLQLYLSVTLKILHFFLLVP